MVEALVSILLMMSGSPYFKSDALILLSITTNSCAKASDQAVKQPETNGHIIPDYTSGPAAGPSAHHKMRHDQE